MVVGRVVVVVTRWRSMYFVCVVNEFAMVLVTVELRLQSTNYNLLTSSHSLLTTSSLPPSTPPCHLLTPTPLPPRHLLTTYTRPPHSHPHHLHNTFSPPPYSYPHNLLTTFSHHPHSLNRSSTLNTLVLACRARALHN